jgi:hypothetical protein
MAKLTKSDVLTAVAKAVRPDSIYIIDQVQRQHDAAVRAGGSGHAPTSALVLRRLKALAADGLLMQSAGTNGYYGYRWDITDAGRAALAEAA